MSANERAGIASGAKGHRFESCLAHFPISLYFKHLTYPSSHMLKGCNPAGPLSKWWPYLFDDAGELLWLFRCGHMTARQHADI